MINHYFSETGEYTASAPANPGALPPANALRVEPEKRPGFWPVLNAARDGWDFVEDHRGEEGWLNGEKAGVTALGPLPEGWSGTPPEPDHSDPGLANHSATAAEAAPVGQDNPAQNPNGMKFSDLVLLEGAEERFLLTRHGTYHTSTCRYRQKPGEWLTREKIYRENPAARPCGLCRPNGRKTP